MSQGVYIYIYIYIYILAWARALNARRNHETEHTKTWHIESESTRSRTPGTWGCTNTAMNLLRTLFNGTERASTRRTLSTWNDHQTCLGKCENAKTLSFQGHGVENELGLRTSFKYSISKPERWTQRKWLTTISWSKNVQTQRRNGQHGEAARSIKWPVVAIFTKSGFGTREIRSHVEKREKHTFEFNIRYFWSRAQEMFKMSFENLKAGIFGPSWRPRNAKK